MKGSRYFLILLAVLILVPVAGHLLWRAQKKNQMDLLIVNKTVPEISKNEVKSLNWVLNYKKFKKEGDNFYNFTSDYYGFHPDAPSSDRAIKAFSLEELPGMKENFDGVIYLDNEGVELNHDKFPNLNHYGGFNNNDYLLIREMMESGKLVVVEYNFFSEPTEELIRYNTEQLMDIYSLSWRGKYFNNLDSKKVLKEVDQKWMEKYTELYDKEWDYKGSGLIQCNDKQDRILVMPEDEYLNGLPLVKTETQFAKEDNLPEEACYSGWFNVVFEGNNKVISRFDLNLNQEGIELLKKNGLDPSFPAFIKLQNKPVFFIAGDFSKQNVFLPASKVRIINDICRGICRGMSNNPRFFFQSYYVPMMGGILSGKYLPGEDI